MTIGGGQVAMHVAVVDEIIKATRGAGHTIPMAAPQIFDLGSGQPNVGLSAGDLPPPLGSRRASANPPVNELHHLQEHYRPSAPHGHSMDHMQNISENHGGPYHSSYFSSRPTMQQSSLPIPVPVSATGPLFRSESDEWTSTSRSYSDDSYSTRSSRSFGSHPYRTVHASAHTPTVIQPSRYHPIVVPIHGGVGGYVVVPAVGQNLQVVEPSGKYKHRHDRSLIGRLLSPSKWGRSKSKRKVIRL
ncbi:hypothetical protein M413DRAFT_29209 [Hebeloma cylindrosporum]|uniref:Uncharacterized protein n=1 Tax=Hebeloma cylindrosporum TaxID=76867 RepID=A0A0C3BRZ1_HEBCY|nr:hypothetical protein M413DRAFT_29209 [Hebeloma cylindrosporum h7]